MFFLFLFSFVCFCFINFWGFVGVWFFYFVSFCLGSLVFCFVFCASFEGVLVNQFCFLIRGLSFCFFEFGMVCGFSGLG